jgi:hypothetical protein
VSKPVYGSPCGVKIEHNIATRRVRRVEIVEDRSYELGCVLIFDPVSLIVEIVKGWLELQSLTDVRKLPLFQHEH